VAPAKAAIWASSLFSSMIQKGWIQKVEISVNSRQTQDIEQDIEAMAAPQSNKIGMAHD
jgi:hypothetical protein